MQILHKYTKKIITHIIKKFKKLSIFRFLRKYLEYYPLFVYICVIIAVILINQRNKS